METNQVKILKYNTIKYKDIIYIVDPNDEYYSLSNA